MNAKGGKSSRRLVVGVLALAAIAALGALAYWKFALPPDDGPAPEATADEVVSGFYTSLAALDVEQNERAATRLSEAVRTAPEEPALWANLAVAQLRLREIDAARQSLDQAVSLAPDARELAVLRGELLQQAGEIEAAIEQLRQVRESWPENIAVTWSLVSLLAQVRSEEAERERLALLNDILTRAPENLRAEIERARLAATLEEPEALGNALAALSEDAERWPDTAQEQLSDAREAASSGEFRGAARSLTFFENLLKPRPEYQQSLQQLGVTAGAAIGSPLRQFLRLEMPQPEAADADTALTFQSQEFPETAVRPDLAWAVEQAGEGRSTLLLSLSGDTLQIGETAALPFPGSSAESFVASVAAADLNFDFRQDLILAGSDGVRIYLGQEDGSFAPQETTLPELEQPWRGVWAFDVEADGDLDLLLSGDDAPLTWIRNNGDMTFTAVPEFLPVQDVRQLRAVDLDGDGDVDLVTLDAAGEAAVWENQRSGQFTAAPAPLEERCLAIAVGDVDRDGRFDIVCLSASGEFHQATWGEEGGWSRSRLTSLTAAEALSGVAPGEAFLEIVDLDNNGAVDLIAGAGEETFIRLRGADGQWTSPAQTPALRAAAVADVDADGLLDLVGLSAEGARVALTRSDTGYGWLVLRPTANTAPGDQRINAFGVGGRIEVRSGSLVQAAPIDSPRVHFGLGRRQSADVARIVWPNGSMQAEFELQANQAVEAQQRLKGSCPWVFAFDGREFRFVKDFIWRSPLGLRINAQSTAGVTQTEDWIKIPGESLAAAGGKYSLRITAELWETHFFDHISLMAVDHPAEVEAFVDERFVPNESPALEVILATPPEPFASAADHRGRSLDAALREIDGVYADGFELGQFQGVAEGALGGVRVAAGGRRRSRSVAHRPRLDLPNRQLAQRRPGAREWSAADGTCVGAAVRRRPLAGAARESRFPRRQEQGRGAAAAGGSAGRGRVSSLSTAHEPGDLLGPPRLELRGARYRAEADAAGDRGGGPAIARLLESFPAPPPQAGHPDLRSRGGRAAVARPGRFLYPLRRRPRAAGEN
jgi:tetratricopeptide (TPR) repeat protein